MSGPTYTSLFCGAGGDLSGAAEAGFVPVLGVNHDPVSIDTASGNFPDAEFLCADINHVDMRKLPHSNVLWASVICTELSPAGGRKKLRGQGQFAYEEMGHVAAATYERTRACALDVIRATEVHRYDAVIVENVVEFARDWELYDWWITGMENLGYRCEVANYTAAHVYSDANAPAPQWRDRIFVVFTRKGIPLPDLSVRPPAWCEHCEKIVESEQRWKRPGLVRPIGKYRQQYLYVCPKCSSIVEPYVLPAIAAVDMSDLGERIGDRKRPLSPNTRARIQWGLENLAWPVIAQVAGNTFERPGYHRVWGADDWPLNARQGTNTDAICGPVVVNHGRTDSRVYDATERPLPTATGKISEGLLYAPFITMLRNHEKATGLDEPIATVTTNGHHHYLTTPAFYVKNFGGNAAPRDLAKSLGDALGSITTHDHHALVIPYRKGSRPYRATDRPLSTATTKIDNYLLRPNLDIDDCYYRTFKSREHLAGQRFDPDYIVTGNEGQRTLQAGNAVAVNCAHHVCARVAEALA